MCFSLFPLCCKLLESETVEKKANFENKKIARSKQDIAAKKLVRACARAVRHKHFRLARMSSSVYFPLLRFFLFLICDSLRSYGSKVSAIFFSADIPLTQDVNGASSTKPTQMYVRASSEPDNRTNHPSMHSRC